MGKLIGQTWHTNGWSFLPVMSGRHPVLRAASGERKNVRTKTAGNGGEGQGGGGRSKIKQNKRAASGGERNGGEGQGGAQTWDGQWGTGVGGAHPVGAPGRATGKRLKFVKTPVGVVFCPGVSFFLP